MRKILEQSSQVTQKSPSLVERGTRWLKRPSAERNRLMIAKLKTISAFPFRFGKANFLNVFLAYQPDSQVSFNNHPEFPELFKSFISDNRMNNAGDMTRLWSLILNIKQVLSENIEGDFAELGVWRGNTASVLAYFALKSGRKVILFDTFEGFSQKDLDGIDANKQMAFADTSVEFVKKVIGAPSAICEFVKGYFPGTITALHKRRQYAIVSLDCDLYEPMKAGLEFFYPLMPKGALLLIHDYSSLHWDGSKKAVDEFCKARNEYAILLPDKSGSALIRKST